MASVAYATQYLEGHTTMHQISSIKTCPKVHSNLNRHSIYVHSSFNQQIGRLPDTINHRKINCSFISGNRSWGRALLTPDVFGQKCSFYHRKQVQQRRVRAYAELDVAGAVDVINDLGFDTLTFLGVTVLVVPAFRIIKASPILGFFFAGVVLNQFGLIRNLTDVKVLSEWGILFLLFEMGLELSLARLKALAKFAFGMGLSQVVLSTLAFTAFELPPNGAIGTRILEFLFHSRLTSELLMKL